jgi:hypothetical protein
MARKVSELWHLPRQITRYKYEKRELKKTFGKCVSFYEEPEFVRLELQATTNQLGNDYTLRIYLPNDFPSSCPFLVVSKPDTPLKDFHGHVLELSYENHCLGAQNDYGLTAICHCRPDRWENDMSMCDVFMKGLEWLEAYEIMIKTGEDIETFLPEMPMSPEKMKKLERLRKKAERDLAEQIDQLSSHERAALDLFLYTLGLLMAQGGSEDEQLDHEELAEC